MKIISVRAIEILDSRGNPTIKAFVVLDDGTIGSASVPSGASRGDYESLELRDKNEHYQGQGVLHAVQNVNSIIANELVGMDINTLEKIDQHMIDIDGTENKTILGANALLSVSLACARAFALHHKNPLWKALNDYYFDAEQTRFPRMMVNIINGGAHADWNTDIQEYMIVPRDRIPTSAIETSANIFHTLKKTLEDQDLPAVVGDEGGFVPTLSSNMSGFDLIHGAITQAGYSRNEIDIATDIAASEFYRDGTYHFEGRTLSSSDLSNYYSSLIQQYNIFSFEDPFDQDDWYAFSQFTRDYGQTHMIVGDDLFVTHPTRIKKGIHEHAANAVLIKLNQVGSLLETVQAITATRKAGWKVIISHRSGETEDSFISDLAVACGADFMKAGSMSRSERMVKYNRLLEIEKVEY
ncbi:phosphopyruvate hydratase [Candidatus Roizmanbacteria bacterium RIFCSPLOWO2_02_FULL_43_10]|uniref:Enolase n=2 Tax=Candidatus Roizmaniibacteriota TaxID=1752723 RepID=A0A1F7K0P4_9BACT|nr:MAG: phosphopyruvate hydratase [Candidatus Roizmanbacteria bacterium RIFCSPHIGHO2_02_FULL_43_11]OGK61435.1 MAG: phosphopyruvate hydratase [Candidatus Roizmanbacteria bacterium RIFCSPLOWO2_02_FULL_43_10]